MEGDDIEKNWSEKIEELVESGDTDAAIFFLENLISNLETLNSSQFQPQLVSALLELANLYSSKGLSLKADHTRSRAFSIDLRSLAPSSTSLVECSTNEAVRVSDNKNLHGSCSSGNEITNNGNLECANPSTDNVAPQASSDDDWESIADRAPDELLSPPCMPEVSKLSLGVTEVKKVANRRGRGTFTYKKQGLYSDELANNSKSCDGSDEILHENYQNVSNARNLYGTHHVLVLDGFNPSTTTTDLERLFEDFREHGFVIRWVNDVLALAVFRNPSVAREAYSNVRCSFKVRVLEENDPIVSSISVRDLDPPRQRPKTSARTAQRLIAQELGVKLPSTFGSKELRKQEDARKDRIVTRQILRDEAWGPDNIK